MHHNSADRKFLHCAVALAARLDADSAIRTVKDTSGYGYAADTSAHFASQNDSAMTMEHSTSGNRDILAGDLLFAILCSCLDRNAIVSNVNGAAKNTHVLTAFRVDPIGIGGIIRVLNRNTRNEHILAHKRMQRPGWAVHDAKIAETDIFALFKADEAGTCCLKRLCPKTVPPSLSISLKNAHAGNRHIVLALCIDERAITVLFISLPACPDDRVILWII